MYLRTAKKEVKELPKRKPIKLSKAVQFSVKCRKQNKKIQIRDAFLFQRTKVNNTAKG